MRIGRKPAQPDTQSVESVHHERATMASSVEADDRLMLVLCDRQDAPVTRIHGAPRFRLEHEGRVYEHFATDAEGRWHYRPMA